MNFTARLPVQRYGILQRQAKAGSISRLSELTTNTSEIWAEHCPENFENRAALVGAEIARIEGRDADALRLYEQAIRSARQNGFVQNEALAYEVAAQFYAARNLEQFADAYLRNARNCYDRWGADGKVRQLDERYPAPARGTILPPPSATIDAASRAVGCRDCR